MEDILKKKCSTHQNEIFTCYCFDDKKFLCDICFKEHRKHNIDLKANLIEYNKMYESFKTDKNIYQTLEEMKSKLNDIKKEMDKILNSISQILSSMETSKAPIQNNNIFNLSFEEYENIEKYKNILDSIDDISYKFNSFKKIFKIKEKKEYVNFRDINKEVKIIENSQTDSIFTLDVMLEKKNEMYSVFNSSTNHYAIFDLGKKLYLSDILISVKQEYGCVLKDFKVSIKNEEGNWEFVNQYQCKDNKFEVDMQSFPIKKEAQFIRIDFLNAWSTDGGNFILIRRLSFKVADIINNSLN